MTKPMKFERAEQIRLAMGRGYTDPTLFDMDQPEDVWALAAHDLLREVYRMWNLFEKLSGCVDGLDIDPRIAAPPKNVKEWSALAQTVHGRAQKVIDLYYNGGDDREDEQRTAAAEARHGSTKQE